MRRRRLTILLTTAAVAVAGCGGDDDEASSPGGAVRAYNKAVADGDGERIATEHATLVRWLDRAAARGAIHPNRAARKKSQAARLVSGPSA